MTAFRGFVASSHPLFVDAHPRLPNMELIPPPLSAGFTFKTKTSTLRASDFEEFKSMRDVALSNAGSSRDSGIRLVVT